MGFPTANLDVSDSHQLVPSTWCVCSKRYILMEKDGIAEME